MRVTTLCYIERGNCYLMLHRVKKKNDANHDKWIGIGGGLEPGESPEDCLKREVYEETGLCLTAYRYRGVIRFHSDQWPDELMHLYTASGFSGKLIACDEGVLEWVDRDRIEALPIWEGDKIFLRLLQANAPFFELTLHYRGDTLTQAVLDSKEVSAKP